MDAKEASKKIESPASLLPKPPERKDGWDKVSALSGFISAISGILIAFVGGYFTYSYNQRQLDLNGAQLSRDAAAKEQANKVGELDTLTKLIPLLSSKNQTQQGAALIAIQNLASPEVAAQEALFIKGRGGIDYLGQAASSRGPNAKFAVRALAAIAADSSQPDSQLASRALSNVFSSAKDSVALLRCGGFEGLGIGVTADGYVLTSSYIIDACQKLGVKLDVTIAQPEGGREKAKLIDSDSSLHLAIAKIDGQGLVPLRFAAALVRPGSTLVGISRTITHSG